MKTIFTSLILAAMALTNGFSLASSVIVDQIYNVRESVSWGFREVRYDLKQWNLYDDGSAPDVFQDTKGAYYTNDGGQHGSSADRALYQAKLSWIKWAEGDSVIRHSSRPAWVPVLDSRFLPDMNISSGAWYYRVGYSDDDDGGVVASLVDKQLLIDVLVAFGKDINGDGQITLLDYDWSSLKRLTGNQLRNLFNTLATETASTLQDSSVIQPLRDMGEVLATFKEGTMAYHADPTKRGLRSLATELREGAELSRTTSVKMADIYLRLFDAAVAPLMLAQVNQYNAAFEGALRTAEGSWSTFAPRWKQDGSQYVFLDFATRSGKRLEIEDDFFPWVWIRNLNTWMWIQQDTERNTQIIYLDSQKLFYHITAIYNRAGVQTGTKWHVFNRSLRKWIPSVNPFP